MNSWIKLRSDFYLMQDFFSIKEARELLLELVSCGNSPNVGFTHPDLKPNRFHSRPKYPVKKYMCYGLYWNPEDYRYLTKIPGTDLAPLKIPEWMHLLSKQVIAETFPHHAHKFVAQAVMVNYYTQDSRMGLHVDKDEEDLSTPVIGINFGSTCRFLFENEKNEPEEVKIPGNSVYIFGDSARLMRHGVATIYQKSLSQESLGILAPKERLNLTLRKVRKTILV